MKTVIEIFYEDLRVDEMIYNIARDAADDIKQETFAVLLEKDQSEIERMYHEGTLFFYCTAIAFRLNKTRLKKSFILVDPETVLDNVSDSDCITEEMMSALQKIDGGNFPYHKTMAELMSKYGTIRNVSKQTGIPRTAIHRSLEHTRKFIRNAAGG